MRRSGRMLATTASAALLLLALAPASYASNDGRGLYGATNDKVVTNAGFIVIGFFVLFVLLMSLLQGRLERRKDMRKAAAKAQSANSHLRGGW